MRRVLQVGLILLVVLNSVPSARADDVTDWNQMMLRAGLIAATSPLNMSRVAALVQSAVFDAVNGIDRRYTPIRVAPAGPAGASRRAAAVQAAYVILAKLFPTQLPTLDARRTDSFTDIARRENAGAIAAGTTWGQTVADAIWTWRLTDGFAPPPPAFNPPAALGHWRRTPNAPYDALPFDPMSGPGAGPQYATMETWAILASNQFLPAGPPALTSAQYARDFAETKLMGSLTSAARTTDQTIFAWFWASGTATSLWNQTALTLIRGNSDQDDRDGGNPHRSLLENARLMAALDVAMADAAIGCWNAKYTYTFWRPITAIREVADDGNANTAADTTWTPLFATPAHPEYPSGHSCVSGAATTILANEFGERSHFTMTSDVMVDTVRSFRSFTAALEEVKNARIVAGIHFRTACDDGTTLGKAVAAYVLANKFQRVR
jgi:PAP2 superfamily